MRIERIELHHVAMKLKSSFQTSFGTQSQHPCVIVSAHAEGKTGWGECVVGLGPFYSSETVMSAWTILKDYLAPMVIGQEISHPSEIPALIHRVRGNEMAKAGLENAVWDLFGRINGKSIMELIGGTRKRVPVGVSIGIQSSPEALVATVGGFLSEGYRRIKIKIKKGLEYETLSAVRRKYPDILMMADANSDYTLADANLLQRLDVLDLLMIEQPLGHDDIMDHAQLQAQLKTPICLDESIHSIDNARHAIAYEACRVINIKVGRVGGISNALLIHEMTQAAAIPLWCGGMFETGVGRAMNLAIASLPNFTLPGDISATNRYYEEDITRPFFLNREDSTMTVPTGAGIGVDVDKDRLAAHRVQHLALTASARK